MGGQSGDEGTVGGIRGQCGDEGTVGCRGQCGMQGTVWDAGDSVGMRGQCAMEGTVRRCRGAVRRLHRAGGDFITQSIIDSDHTSGGQRRNAQCPHQGGVEPLQPSACRRRAGTPRQNPPSHVSPGIAAGPPAAPCGAGITPNWPISFPLGRGTAAASLADHPAMAKGSKETLLGLAFFPPCLPSLGQPCIPLQGQLLLCSPSACRVRTPGRSSPQFKWLLCREKKSFLGFLHTGIPPQNEVVLFFPGIQSARLCSFSWVL